MRLRSSVCACIYALCAGALAAVPAYAQRSGTTVTRHAFDVKRDANYADFIQFENGHAQGVLVFYFVNPVNGLDRAVVFCRGSDSGGDAMEDAANRRLVVRRPLTDFALLSRFHNARDGTTVYGVWETAPDGTVVKFAIQANKSMAMEKPDVGVEYTGKSQSKKKN
jgi:hypothetical protein